MLFACALAAGCGKHKHSEATGGASPSASSAPPRLRAGISSGAWGGEAQRGRITQIGTEPLLAQARDLVAAHFGGKAPAALDYQRTELESGVQALLLSQPGAPVPDPLLVVIGRHQKVLWTRKRPLAGIVPGFGQVTLSRGPRGDVALFWFNEPSATVATRMWDVKGGLLMDAQVMETDGCDALSVFYWPGRGWVVAAARPSSSLIQLLGESGDREFGQQGKTIANRWRAAAPVSIAADTQDSVMLFQLGYLSLSPNAASGDHLLAHRYDAHGTPLWRGPLDAGRLPSRVTDEAVRVAVRHSGPGTVLASLPDAAAGGHFRVEVQSRGTAELR